MTYLEGVYWDLDGTIANTELEAHLPAFNFAFNDFNLNWNWDRSTYLDLLKINGGKNRISYYSKLINKSLNNKEVPILHPGPINRDIEISSKIVDRYPNCLINNQVANGIPVRMALLYLLQKYNQ